MATPSKIALDALIAHPSWDIRELTAPESFFHAIRLATTSLIGFPIIRRI
jgi:hypothetical protein